MKKKYIIILIIILLVLLKEIFIINNSLTSKEKEKLNKIKEGLIVNDLIVVQKEEKEKYIEYDNLKIEDLGFTCNKNKKVLKCTNSQMTMEIEKTKSISEELNIKEDDLLLLGKIKDTTSNNILKSIKKIKEDYKLNKYAINKLPKIKSLDIVEGNFKGLLLHNSSSERTLLVYGKDTYKIYFKNMNDLIKDDYLNTINIG